MHMLRADLFDELLFDLEVAVSGIGGQLHINFVHLPLHDLGKNALIMKLPLSVILYMKIPYSCYKLWKPEMVCQRLAPGWNQVKRVQGWPHTFEKPDNNWSYHQVNYRDRLKRWYADARNFLLLLLDFSDRPSMGQFAHCFRLLAGLCTVKYFDSVKLQSISWAPQQSKIRRQMRSRRSFRPLWCWIACRWCISTHVSTTHACRWQISPPAWQSLRKEAFTSI